MSILESLKKAIEIHEICPLMNELDLSNKSVHYYKISAVNAFFRSQERVEIVPAKDQQTAVNDFLIRIGRLYNVTSIIQLA